MFTMIAAAVLAAQPTSTAPPAQPTQHDMPMQMGRHADHEGMDCCKDCCEHMTAEQRSGAHRH